jgi:lipopolysaccharide/colanic/teichoic acid biosynthesis glycosyltransferase/SAM-dependent methyltransferase
LPVLTCDRSRLDYEEFFVLKRLVDIFCSFFGLIVFAPVLTFLATTIKLTSRGPVFYRGRRVGLHGKPFRIYKFRSMVINAEQLGGPSTSDFDPRITTIGKFMRKCKLDELPQLINVLIGDMSLVGPRPEVQKYVDLYTDEEKALLQLRPGITDWASIWNSDEGAVLAISEDPDRAYEELIRPTKLHLQLAYARHHSLWIDLKIVLYTLGKLLMRDLAPSEIDEVLKATNAPDLKALIESASQQHEYSSVTELPGHGATAEQFSMLHTRYNLAAKLADGKDVLELACGPGVALGHLHKTSNRVVGGDLDPALVKSAEQHYGGRVEVCQIDAQSLPFDDNTFDVILLLEAVYYLPNPEAFVAEAKRVLRRDGTVLICSANRERPDFNPSPYAQRYFSASELKQLLANFDFDVELFGGYPVRRRGARDWALAPLRWLSIKLKLIPKSMAWKIRLKRLLYGKLKPIPAELDIRENECEPLVRLEGSKSAGDFKVIYAVGRKAA